MCRELQFYKWKVLLMNGSNVYTLSQIRLIPTNCILWMDYMVNTMFYFVYFTTVKIGVTHSRLINNEFNIYIEIYCTVITFKKYFLFFVYFCKISTTKSYQLKKHHTSFSATLLENCVMRLLFCYKIWSTGHC